MAKLLSKSGMATGQTITAAQLTQSIDALTGVDDYILKISGSLEITGSITGQPGVTNNLTASYAIEALTEITKEVSSSFADLAANLTMEPNITVTQITASGNIDFNGDLDVDGTTNLDVVDIDGAVDMASTLVVASHITASGNISSSGDIKANTFSAGGSNILSFQSAVNPLITRATLSGVETYVFGDDTTPNATRITGTNIYLNAPVTASSNISASGVITAEGLVISDDASITDDLTVGDKLIIDGTISGSGQMNLKLNTISVANRSDADVTKTLTAATYPNGSLLSLTCNNTNGLGGSRDLQLTLPAVAVSAGRNLSAVVKEAANSQCELKIVSTDSGVLQGLIVNEADGRTAISNRTNIVIGTSDTDRGDRFDLMCDGTYWYVYGFRLGAEADISLS